MFVAPQEQLPAARPEKFAVCLEEPADSLSQVESPAVAQGFVLGRAAWSRRVAEWLSDLALEFEPLPRWL